MTGHWLLMDGEAFLAIIELLSFSTYDSVKVPLNSILLVTYERHQLAALVCVCVSVWQLSAWVCA